MSVSCRFYSTANQGSGLITGDGHSVAMFVAQKLERSILHGKVRVITSPAALDPIICAKSCAQWSYHWNFHAILGAAYRHPWSCRGESYFSRIRDKPRGTTTRSIAFSALSPPTSRKERRSTLTSGRVHEASSQYDREISRYKWVRQAHLPSQELPTAPSAASSKQQPRLRRTWILHGIGSECIANQNWEWSSWYVSMIAFLLDHTKTLI